MGEIINVAVRLIRAGRLTYTRKWSFFGLFAVAFLGSVSILGQLDLLPEEREPSTISETPLVMSETNVPELIEMPTRVEVQKIKLSATVVNPNTTDIAALDAELLNGAVRYPVSARLGETGNVVLFGHSSYLPIVKNQAYKTFNGIQKLAAGDSITVYSSTTAYIYRVRSVTKEDVSVAAIPLSVAGKVLTLSTCNSFGATGDRFVVTADFVESNPIST